MATHRDIMIVGCGPGSAEYVTPAAAIAAESAATLIGVDRLFDLFPRARGNRVAVTGHVAPALEAIDASLPAGPVAVLVSGDTGFHSLARPVIQHFGLSRCQLIPGVSSLQVAFARLGLDWADARIISAHGRTPTCSAADLAGEMTIAVLAGTPQAITWAAGIVACLDTTHVAFLCEDLTLPGEGVQQVSAQALTMATSASLSIIVIVHRDILKSLPSQGSSS